MEETHQLQEMQAEENKTLKQHVHSFNEENQSLKNLVGVLEADVASPRARFRRLRRLCLLPGLGADRESAVQILKPSIERCPTELFLYAPRDELVELQLSNLIPAEGSSWLGYERGGLARLRGCRLRLSRCVV